MPITKTITKRQTGDNDSAVQVFIENTFVDIPKTKTLPFNFEVPVYTLQGATYNYYNQNIDREIGRASCRERV